MNDDDYGHFAGTAVHDGAIALSHATTVTHGQYQLN
jgi:hypothetical protein